LRRAFSLLAAFVLFSSLAVAQEPPVLTLDAAFARAIDANLSLERARRELAIAEAQQRVALSAILPKIAVSASGLLNSKEVTFGAPPDSLLILPKQDWTMRAVAIQPLFAGLRELRARDQAKIAVRSAQEGEHGVAEDTLLFVTAAYAGALGNQAIVKVEENNLSLVEARRKQARDLFEAGETTRVDVLRAEADLKAAEDRLVSARQRLAESLADLRVLLALDHPIGVVEPDTALPPLPSEAELVAMAQTRPDVKQAENALETVALEVKKQRGAYFPVVYAEGGYVKQKVAFPTEEYGYGALRFSFDIFSGGETKARVAVAKEREEQARLSLEELRRRVREDVKVKLLGVESARTRVALSGERLQAAQAEYEQSFEQYRSQLLTSVDLQSAEASLSDARRALVSARLDFFLSQVQVWHATGNLLAVARREAAR
jgi:outer membrane protein